MKIFHDLRLYALLKPVRKIEKGSAVKVYFYRRAYRNFGSWDNALIAAGLDPSKIRLKTRWTKDKVINTIIERSKNGLPLNAAAISNNSLYKRARIHFGSWDNALKAAGIDPNTF